MLLGLYADHGSGVPGSAVCTPFAACSSAYGLKIMNDAMDHITLSLFLSQVALKLHEFGLMSCHASESHRQPGFL